MQWRTRLQCATHASFSTTALNIQVDGEEHINWEMMEIVGDRIHEMKRFGHVYEHFLCNEISIHTSVNTALLKLTKFWISSIRLKVLKTAFHRSGVRTRRQQELIATVWEDEDIAYEIAALREKTPVDGLSYASTSGRDLILPLPIYLTPRPLENTHFKR